MEGNDDEEQSVPANATDDDILKELSDEETTNGGNEDEGEGGGQDSFVYFKSSSVISILIIVIISLVCILATSLMINTILRSHGITRKLSIYFGFTPNRTIDESTLTFWSPHSISDEQPIETSTTMINSSSFRPPSSLRPIVLSKAEKKAHLIFRNVFLPVLFLLSILFGILAFYLRRYHHFYPAWGARPKKPEPYVTFELKQQPQTNVYI